MNRWFPGKVELINEMNRLYPLQSWTLQLWLNMTRLKNKAHAFVSTISFMFLSCFSLILYFCLSIAFSLPSINLFTRMRKTNQFPFQFFMLLSLIIYFACLSLFLFLRRAFPQEGEIQINICVMFYVFYVSCCFPIIIYFCLSIAFFLFLRRTCPREGEIQINFRRIGHNLLRTIWLLAFLNNLLFMDLFCVSLFSNVNICVACLINKAVLPD